MEEDRRENKQNLINAMEHEEEKEEEVKWKEKEVKWKEEEEEK